MLGVKAFFSSEESKMTPSLGPQETGNRWFPHEEFKMSGLDRMENWELVYS